MIKRSWFSFHSFGIDEGIKVYISYYNSKFEEDAAEIFHCLSCDDNVWHSQKLTAVAPTLVFHI